MNRLWAVHHLVMVVYNIHTVFINWFHSKCYVHVYVSANVLKCYSSKKYLLECILDKLDNKMMPSVVHYETHAKWLFFFFLNPISIFILCSSLELYIQWEQSVVTLMCLSKLFIITTSETFWSSQLRPCTFIKQAAQSTAVRVQNVIVMSSDLQLLQGFFSFECASPVLQKFGLQSQH